MPRRKYTYFIPPFLQTFPIAEKWEMSTNPDMGLPAM